MYPVPALIVTVAIRPHYVLVANLYSKGFTMWDYQGHKYVPNK